MTKHHPIPPVEIVPPAKLPRGVKLSPDGMVMEIDLGDTPMGAGVVDLSDMSRRLAPAQDRAARDVLEGRAPEAAQSEPLVVTPNGERDTLAGVLRGMPMFLICSGPSLKTLDESGELDALRRPGLVTFGINNAPAVFGPVNYWICHDQAAKFLEAVWTDGNCHKFVPPPLRRHKIVYDDGTESDRAVENAANVRFYRRHALDTDRPRVPFHQIPFLSSIGCWVAGPPEGDGAPEGSGAPYTLYAALRLAHWLGCRELNLVGCDFDAPPEQPHAHGVAETHKAATSKWNNARFAMHNRNLTHFAQQFEAAGFRVFNCNPASKLTAFPHKPLADAIADAKAWSPREARGADTAERYAKHDQPRRTGRPARPKTYAQGVNVLIPTGDRSVPLALTLRCLARQTYRPPVDAPVRVVIVDDGHDSVDLAALPKLPDGYALSYERRKPTGRDPQHTLALKVRHALNERAVDRRRLVFMEDSTWYDPTYLAEVMRALDAGDLAGQQQTAMYAYFHRAWRRHVPDAVALHGTGLKSHHYEDLYTAACGCSGTRDEAAIDLRLWHTGELANVPVVPPDRRVRFGGEAPLAVKVRGLPGKRGIHVGHGPDTPGKNWTGDPELKQLRAWIGDADTDWLIQQTEATR
ncbi:MAG: glycosyltransferase family A protein [Planctomycetota bacterium]